MRHSNAKKKKSAKEKRKREEEEDFEEEEDLERFCNDDDEETTMTTTLTTTLSCRCNWSRKSSSSTSFLSFTSSSSRRRRRRTATTTRHNAKIIIDQRDDFGEDDSEKDIIARDEHKRAEKKKKKKKKKIAIVFGATGGVGQLVCAKLLKERKNEDDDGFDTQSEYYDVVYAMCRNRATGKETLFVNKGNDDDDDEKRLRVREVDVREERDVEKALETIMAEGNDDEKGEENDGKDVDVVCCLGTTAFPSARWKENNGPEQTDDIATANVIRAAKKICFRNTKKKKGEKKSRFVMISSVGVTRTDKMPYIVLNLFGVLKYKRKSETYLERLQKENADDFDFTIIRPGRLTDGPYTSYDLNTLLKATSSERRRVEIKSGDDFDPAETSRIAVADCAVFSASSARAANKAFVIGTKEGDGGPGQEREKWDALFRKSLS